MIKFENICDDNLFLSVSDLIRVIQESAYVNILFLFNCKMGVSKAIDVAKVLLFIAMMLRF